MRSLIKWEIKKIFGNKAVSVILILMTLLTLNVYLFPGLRETAIADTGEQLSGVEAIDYKRNLSEKLLKDEVSTESVKRDLQYFINHYDRTKNTDGNDLSLGFDKEVFEKHIYPREKYLRWAVQNYSDPNNIDSYYALEGLTQKELDGFGDFYQQTGFQVDSFLDNYPYGNLSEKEKVYWKSLSSSIETPYRLGFYEFAENAVDQSFVFIIVLAALLLSISNIFSSEYEKKTDRILLTSKNGRTKLVKAKIITAYSFILFFLTLFIFIGLGSHFAIYGNTGMDLPLQLSNTVIAYPWTYGQMLKITIGIIYIIALGLTALCLFISSRSKKTVIPVIWIIVLLIGSTMIQPGTIKLLDKFLYLLPIRITGSAYQIYQSYTIFGKVFNIYEMASLVYIVLFIFLTPLAAKSFQNHKLN